MEQLREKVDFCFWEKFDENRTVVRFATSWSTSEADLLALKQLL
jgi:threonine aldolase